jgi:hypothetical protein
VPGCTDVEWQHHWVGQPRTVADEGHQRHCGTTTVRCGRGGVPASSVEDDHTWWWH